MPQRRVLRERSEDERNCHLVIGPMDHPNRVTAADRSWGRDRQVGAGPLVGGEGLQPARDAEEAAERAARDPRNCHPQLDRVADLPDLADSGRSEVEAGRGEVVAECAVG